MSFTDSAAEVLDRTESSLCSLMSEAIKAQAYNEVAAIAVMAQSVAGIGRGRSEETQRRSTGTSEAGAQAGAAAAKTSWMRPST